MTGTVRSFHSIPNAVGWLALSLVACTEDPLPGEICVPGAACADGGHGGQIVTVDAATSGPPTGPVVSVDSATPQPDAGTVVTTDAGSGGGAFPCDVQKVLAEKCTLCHAAGQQGPMPLTRPEHFFLAAPSAPGQRVHDVVRARINHADPRLKMPPPSQAPLTSAELATLNTWLDQGAPSGAERCEVSGDGGAPSGPANLDGLDCYEITAHAPDSKTAKYQVGAARDSYMIFEFAAPWQGTAYPIYFESIIDNPAVLHHWLLYAVNNPRDGLVEPTIGNGTGTEFLFGWAPGGVPLDMREHGDVGFELVQGQGLRLEIHYNSGDPSAQDASGTKVCVKRERPANIAATWWLGSDNIIPSTEWVGLCDPISEEPIHIVGVTPHMHLKGIHMRGVINRADGSESVLHDGPFSFNDQTFYRKQETVMPGDTITTTCKYSEPKSFGQGTEEEMCYLFAIAYPKDGLADLGGVLGWGSIAHGANACVGALPF